MAMLKYTLIKNKAKYNQYCRKLEELLDSGSRQRSVQDEIELLTLLIEKYDEAHNSFRNADPVDVLRSLMEDHQMRPIDLAGLLGMSKGYVSDILNYKKGFSKDVIRLLAKHFRVAQEAFNRPYELKEESKAPLKKAG